MTIQLCLYCELEEWETLEENWPKIRNFLEKWIVFPTFWEICTQLFDQLAQPLKSSQRKKAIEQFLQKTNQMLGEQTDSNVSSHFDFPAWAESFLNGKGMAKTESSPTQEHEG